MKVAGTFAAGDASMRGHLAHPPKDNCWPRFQSTPGPDNSWEVRTCHQEISRWRRGSTRAHS